MGKLYRPLLSPVIVSGVLLLLLMNACGKHDDIIPENTTDAIRIDSMVATKRNLVVWEESYITVYATGTHLQYKWETDHGSMLGRDSTTVTYWACPSCLGHNTIKCIVSNESGYVSDTLMVHVTD